MKSIYNNSSRNILQRDNFQDSLDFFYERYLDFFPGGAFLPIGTNFT